MTYITLFVTDLTPDWEAFVLRGARTREAETQALGQFRACWPSRG